MNALDSATLVRWLRVAGEPTRIRLLALCADGALSVSDLARVLSQSEPRVSRHLKILCEGGLIARVREGQWVRYRLAEPADAASFVRGLIGQLDRTDPVLARDRAGARGAAREARTGAQGAESRLGRTLAGLVSAETGSATLGSVLVIGVGHPELLESVVRGGGRCTAIAHSRRAAQGARAFAERRGFSCRVLQTGAAAMLSEADLARAGGPFDTVLLDQAVSAARLVQWLERVRCALRLQGRVWVFERYDSLETARGRVVEHPLARLRRLLGEAGLSCERLSPVEADGEHVLAAVARAAAVLDDIGGAAGGAR
jgi:DNA-binding transcriptional ArsR family regulator